MVNIVSNTFHKRDDGSYEQSITAQSVASRADLILSNRARSLFSTDKASSFKDDQISRQVFDVPFSPSVKPNQPAGPDGIVPGALTGTPSLDDNDLLNRFYSHAIYKFNDTSIGGSYAINPRPQFTPYADIRVRNDILNEGAADPEEIVAKIETITGSGLGVYYSEAFDDTQQMIHLRFGHPQFNSLTTFFGGFFEGNQANAARTGRYTTDFFTWLGNTAGLVVSVLYLPLLAVNILGSAYRFFANKPTTRFYNLKPAMASYWLTVNSMVNQIAVNRGLYPRVPFVGDSRATPGLNSADQKMGDGFKIDADAMANFAKIMPDVFSADGSIDVMSIASRAQRMKTRFDRAVQEALEKGDAKNYEGFVASVKAGLKDHRVQNVSIIEMVKAWVSTSYGKKSADGGSDAEIDPRAIKQTTENTASLFDSKTLEYFDAEMNDGSAFATFRVDYTGPVSESFTNNATESDLQRKFNDTSSSQRAARFTFADGNIMGGAVGAVVGGIAEAAKGLMTGALDALNISGIMALGGSAFVDIPKHWDTSSASLPRGNYSMTLISPYGNPISQITNIYIPMCMLLAGALPLATGKQSYTSPFLCQLYDRGRCQTTLGMIDSLNFQRGTSNLGFNKQGNFMSVDVSFSVVDLSSMISVPIARGFQLSDLANVLKGVFSDDNAYTDYMAILSSLSVQQQAYVLNKFKLNLAKKIRSYNFLSSPAYWSAFAHEHTPIGWFDIFYRGMEKL
jgi:hypothetical protein